MTAGLRIMVYDATQRGLEAKYLSAIWGAGAVFGRFDRVVAAYSWEHAYDRLAEIAARGDVLDQLQFWGHGSAGHAYIDDVPMALDKLAHAIDPMVDHESIVWLRACDTFRGTIGQAFAVAATRELGCSVVGHTRIVSAPWPTHQSGGYWLRPGETPWWSSTDGGGSYPWAPNTCLVTRMSPPPEWRRG